MVWCGVTKAYRLLLYDADVRVSKVLLRICVLDRVQTMKAEKLIDCCDVQNWTKIAYCILFRRRVYDHDIIDPLSCHGHILYTQDPIPDGRTDVNLQKYIYTE